MKIHLPSKLVGGHMAEASHIIDRIISETSPEDLKFYDWQFKLSTRLCQIMEAGNFTQPEFARMVGITEEQLDDLLHVCADPPLSLMARIQALSKSELLTWVNTDVLQGNGAARNYEMTK